MSALTMKEALELADCKYAPSEPFTVQRSPLDSAYGDVYSPNPYCREATLSERLNKTKTDLLIRLEKFGVDPVEGYKLVPTILLSEAAEGASNPEVRAFAKGLLETKYEVKE